VAPEATHGAFPAPEAHSFLPRPGERRASFLSFSIPTLTYNMTTEINDTPSVDWVAIERGLEELKRRPKLSTLIGDPQKFHRYQMRLSAIENALLKTINVALTAIVGRGVTHALVHRLALSLLAEQCSAALRDPAAAARLKAKLLAVREERRSEHA
jgi:hypothetical protein